MGLNACKYQHANDPIVDKFYQARDDLNREPILPHVCFGFVIIVMKRNIGNNNDHIGRKV